MANVKDILVPDIGDFEGVEVIEILVSPGDSVNIEDPLVSLESDKAAMEIPSEVAGTVKEVKVNLGDAVSQGDLLLTMEVSDAAPATAEEKPAATPAAEETPKAAEAPAATDDPREIRAARRGPRPAHAHPLRDGSEGCRSRPEPGRRGDPGRWLHAHPRRAGHGQDDLRQGAEQERQPG